MSRTARTTRKTIDVIASHNEDAALAVMRAAERMSDELLKQQLFNVIHRLNQDAAELRLLRESLPLEEPKRA
ncbi:hypothetical protein IB232_20255 [Pseudomonas sp. PDM15]|uniref:hypothetical protein n=1 Tax=Pseudomonas sp. PDM15 TaxID=2769303 RepID=UPI001786D826|nr:hypothetical protein [Pseudomonas sp. PDM15]MBD9427676.1 hypothetical protein [Pseudomonas sp. PDM15]